MYRNNIEDPLIKKLRKVQGDSVNPEQPSNISSNRGNKRSPKNSTQKIDTTWFNFLSYCTKYATVREKGAAVWLPEDVKRRLEDLRKTSNAKLPIRSMAAAIIMTFLDDNEERVQNF